MAIHLTLEEARIVKSQGFGNINFKGLYLVQLEDCGLITIHSKRVFGGYQKIYSLECGQTELSVGTLGITTGGWLERRRFWCDWGWWRASWRQRPSTL
jgi:hypothetical protein